MSQKKNPIVLPPDERGHLDELLRKGKASALVLARARILLIARSGDDLHAPLRGAAATLTSPTP